MRHHNQNRKFGREKNQRNALLKSLARSLVLKQKIKTTEPKAKEIRPYVEKLVTIGKTGTLYARRSLVEKIGSDATKILMGELSKKYEDRKGGYTRILKIERRESDGSKMAIIEFV
jgi:ribosomal protein L17